MSEKAPIGEKEDGSVNRVIPPGVAVSEYSWKKVMTVVSRKAIITRPNKLNRSLAVEYRVKRMISPATHAASNPCHKE